MKKIIILIFLLPTLFFGQNKLSDKDLINLEFKIKSGNYYKLQEDGQLLRKYALGSYDAINSTYSSSSGWWWLNKDELSIISDWGITYNMCINCFDINFNFGDGIKTRWVKKNNNGYSYSYFVKNTKSINFIRTLNNPYYSLIDEYIVKRIENWEIQGEFEKTINFNERVSKNSREEYLNELKKEAINFYKKKIIKEISSSDIIIGKYNPDNETFFMSITSFESINFPVPISKAESFKKNFDPSNFSNLNFIYAKDGFIISKIDINGFSYNLFSQE